MLAAIVKGVFALIPAVMILFLDDDIFKTSPSLDDIMDMSTATYNVAQEILQTIENLPEELLLNEKETSISSHYTAFKTLQKAELDEDDEKWEIWANDVVDNIGATGEALDVINESIEDVLEGFKEIAEDKTEGDDIHTITMTKSIADYFKTLITHHS